MVCWVTQVRRKSWLTACQLSTAARAAGGPGGVEGRRGLAAAKLELAWRGRSIKAAVGALLSLLPRERGVCGAHVAACITPCRGRLSSWWGMASFAERCGWCSGRGRAMRGHPMGRLTRPARCTSPRALRSSPFPTSCSSARATPSDAAYALPSQQPQLPTPQGWQRRLLRCGCVAAFKGVALPAATAQSKDNRSPFCPGATAKWQAAGQ